MNYSPCSSLFLIVLKIFQQSIKYHLHCVPLVGAASPFPHPPSPSNILSWSLHNYQPTQVKLIEVSTQALSFLNKRFMETISGHEMQKTSSNFNSVLCWRKKKDSKMMWLEIIQQPITTDYATFVSSSGSTSKLANQASDKHDGLLFVHML